MGVLDFLNTGLQAGAQVLNQFNMRKTWEREDNAVQRRVKDLKAAGLSPTLAAGSAAGVSAPIRIEAPEFTNKIGQQSASIAQTKAQTGLINTQQQAEWAKSYMPFKVAEALANEYNLQNRTKSLIYSIIDKQIAENQEVKRNIDIYKEFGLPSTGHAGDDVIASVKLMEQLFPGMDVGKVGGASVMMRILSGILAGAMK